MATLLGVSKVAVYIVLTAHTNNGKTLSAERNCGRQPKLSERDCHTLKRIVSKNHSAAVAQVLAELSTHVEDSASAKTVQRELHKPSIYGRAEIAKPLIDNNAKR
jgi:transposase